MFNSQSQYIHVGLNPTSTVWHLRLGSYRGKIKEHLHLFSGLFIPRSRTLCRDRSRPIKHWVNGGGRSTTLPWAKILPTFGHFKGHHIARKRGMRTKAIQPKVVIWINISVVTLEVNKRPDGTLSLSPSSLLIINEEFWLGVLGGYNVSQSCNGDMFEDGGRAFIKQGGDVKRGRSSDSRFRQHSICPHTLSFLRRNFNVFWGMALIFSSARKKERENTTVKLCVLY